MDSYGFFSMVNCPTRITRISKSCIDHIFIKSRRIDVFRSNVFDNGITDHCMLGLSLVQNCKIGGVHEKTKIIYLC